MMYKIVFLVPNEEKALFWCIFDLFRDGITLVNKQVDDDGKVCSFSLVMFNENLNDIERRAIEGLKKIFKYEEITI